MALTPTGGCSFRPYVARVTSANTVSVSVQPSGVCGSAPTAAIRASQISRAGSVRVLVSAATNATVATSPPTLGSAVVGAPAAVGQEGAADPLVYARFFTRDSNWTHPFRLR